MHLGWLGLLLGVTALAGCNQQEASSAGPRSPGRYAGIGTFDAGRLWRQIPPDAPAIIDIVYPFEHWSQQVPDIKAELLALSVEFFRSTKRINYVYFSHEQFIRKQGGGGLLVDTQICWHENPRIVSPSLDQTLRNYPPHHFEIERRLRLEGLDDRGGPGEFAQWVNAVLGT